MTDKKPPETVEEPRASKFDHLINHINTTRQIANNALSSTIESDTLLFVVKKALLKLCPDYPFEAETITLKAWVNLLALFRSVILLGSPEERITALTRLCYVDAEELTKDVHVFINESVQFILSRNHRLSWGVAPESSEDVLRVDCPLDLDKLLTLINTSGLEYVMYIHGELTSSDGGSLLHVTRILMKGLQKGVTEEFQ